MLYLEGAVLAAETEHILNVILCLVLLGFSKSKSQCLLTALYGCAIPDQLAKTFPQKAKSSAPDSSVRYAVMQ
jgi:hypothetical protein